MLGPEGRCAVELVGHFVLNGVGQEIAGSLYGFIAEGQMFTTPKKTKVIIKGAGLSMWC